MKLAGPEVPVAGVQERTRAGSGRSARRAGVHAARCAGRRRPGRCAARARVLARRRPGRRHARHPRADRARLRSGGSLPRGVGALPARARAPLSRRARGCARCRRPHRCARAPSSASMRRGSASAAIRPAAHWRRPRARRWRAPAARALALQLLLCPILDYSRLTGSRREFASRLSRRAGHTRSRPQALLARRHGSRRSARFAAARRRPLGIAADHHPHRRIRSAAR